MEESEWLAAGVADVDDPDLCLLDAVVDLVGITWNREFIGAALLRFRSEHREVSKEPNGVHDGPLDVPRALGIVLIKVLKNCLTLGEGARQVPHSHRRPWRLSDSATTSSGTNSPRRACSAPSR